MSASFILLSAVVCISITLCAYFFYSLPFVNSLLRAKGNHFFNTRLAFLTFLFSAFIFTAVETIFLYQEGYSFFALPWPIKGTFFAAVFILVLGVIRLVSGDLLVSAPQYYVEKIFSLESTFEEDSAIFLEIITHCKGKIILDALDKKIIIASLPLSSFEGSNSQQEVIVECTFSESFLKSALVQIVCYPALRGVFIEKTTMNLVLDYFELWYTEKILESLS
jgi:hypothetical protein